MCTQLKKINTLIGRSTAESMYQETIQRQCVLETKYEVDEICSRITEIEKYLAKQASIQHNDMQKNQNNSIAIYDLFEKHDDVTKTVNKLLYEHIPINNRGLYVCLLSHNMASD